MLTPKADIQGQLSKKIIEDNASANHIIPYIQVSNFTNPGTPRSINVKHASRSTQLNIHVSNIVAELKLLHISW